MVYDAEPLPTGAEILKMTDEEILKGDQATLMDRRYALLLGQAYDWDEGSTASVRAERLIAMLEEVIEPEDEDTVR